MTSSVFIFLLLKRKVSQTAGFLGMIFFLFLPYNIFFTRVILPENLMVTLTLGALLLFDLNLLTLGAVVGALAILVKPVALFFFLPLVIKHWRRIIVMLLPLWPGEFGKRDFLVGIPANLWLLNGNGIRFKGAFFQWIFGERIGHLILGSWGVYPLIEGLLTMGGYWVWWVVGALLYLFTFATGNVHHDYYQIPIIPIISILLALGVAKANTLYKKY